jgi:putative salt-induced outer membrane protein YdiY
MRYNLLKPTLTAALALCGTAASHAGTVTASGKSGKQNAVQPAAEQSPWELTAATGVSMTRGNSENMLFNAGILASYLTASDTLYIGANYLYGETDGSQSANNLNAFITYDHLVNDWFYWGINNDFLSDDQRGLDYRAAILPKVGAYLVKSDTTKFGLETGFGYVWENQGVETSYTTLYFGEKFEHQISAGTKIFQSLSFTPEAGDFDNYLIIAEAGIETAISEHWALRLTARDTYDGTPAAGAKENDFSLVAGLAWSAAGFSKPAAGPVRRTLKPPAALPSPIAKGWTNTAALGFGISSGNTDTLLGTLNYSANYHGDSNEFSFGAQAAYGETNSAVNTQNALISASQKNLIGSMFYFGEGISFQYNDVAGVDYRVNPALLLGAYLLKNDRVSLSVDVGPAFVFEKVGGVSDSYFALQAGEKLEWKITETFAIGQSVLFVPRADDLGDYQIIGTAYLDAAMTDDLSLRVSLSDIYDSTPSAGRKANDLLLTAGVAVRF